MTVGKLWPDCSRSKQVTLRREDGLVLVVHRDVMELVAICCDVIEAMGYDLVPGWCWGFACRPIKDTNTPSRHSDGSAIDLNAPNNPRRADRKFVSDIPRHVIEFMETAGWRWGGRFSWPDPMHFEWPKSGIEAKLKAAELRVFFDRPPPTYLPPESDDVTPEQQAQLDRIERAVVVDISLDDEVEPALKAIADQQYNGLVDIERYSPPWKGRVFYESRGDMTRDNLNNADRLERLEHLVTLLCEANGVELPT